MRIAYYITGHGYGHAVRSCAVAAEFGENTKLFIRTSVGEAFFREELHRPFVYMHGEFDCGCIQSDSVTVDITQTLESYMALADANEVALGTEVQWCRDNGIDGIVSDITPFAFEIAHAAGLPSVGITNFSWHDIYEPYCETYSDFRPYLSTICRQYGYADLLVALSPPNALKCFRKKIDVPVVGRKGNNLRDELHRHLSVSSSKKLALVYLGTFGIDTSAWHGLERFGEWYFLGMQPLDNSPRNYRYIPKDMFRYQDLCASVDLIVSKIGYGIYSDCLLNGVPLLYLPRTDFVEFPVLEQSMKDWGHGYRLGVEEFLHLAWDDVLKSVSEQSGNIPPMTSGATVAARAIEKVVEAGRV